MVNITYDASGSIIYTDDSGTQTVYQNGDIAWTLAGTALVFIMIPGLGVMTLAVVSFQWFFWGFSLAFSETGSAFIGDLKYFGMRGVAAEPSIGSARIPSLVFAVYQLMFAAITPMLALGAVSERGRLGPCIAFVFIWSTLVYDPIACWTWNSNGWSFLLGGLDFAGGSPVHISSGSAALAISIYLGKRRGYGTERLAYKPHNTSYVILGTALLWFGWFGFNGGSALSANLRAAMACTVTNLAASVGGLTWMLWDYRIERKYGAIAGLVAITPGSGFVGALCNFATQLKFVFGYDDTLDPLSTKLVLQKSVIHSALAGTVREAGGFAEKIFQVESLEKGLESLRKGAKFRKFGGHRDDPESQQPSLGSACHLLNLPSSPSHLPIFAMDHPAPTTVSHAGVPAM
ncbi:ammonium transporter AmtB-like domain-containing protein [Lentinula boryana]|uniref:Ammonium transporter AmtB-like domain-containing protein n=1 Tax=Lentinula boryana TaxID=40481 RepID=A0ABQ8Q4M6_9AGAR|nr:ammonium transporter AmtB-like domain-containing protein [Lentinula boryana]